MGFKALGLGLQMAYWLGRMRVETMGRTEHLKICCTSSTMEEAT